MKKLTLILFIVCLSINCAHAQSFEQLMNDDNYSIRDWSDSSIVCFPEPNRAYVNITGIESMPTKKGVDYHAWMEVYDDNGNYFKKRVIIDGQGESSIKLPKKNFAVDFCEDEWKGDKTTEITIGNWVPQDGFHFKAFYNDALRGVGEANYKFFSQITEDRIPYWNRGGIEGDSKARCFPDAFPCIVYLNGDFYGVFAWQLKKHRDNMNMKKDVAEQIHLDGNLKDDFIFRGNINWEKFEVRNPKTLYCTTTKEVSGYKYQSLTDENEIASIGGNYEECEDKPSDWSDSEIKELYGKNPPKYLYRAKKEKWYVLTELSGLAYTKYNGDNPNELIDESMPYFDPNNKDHVRTAQVKKYIMAMSQYWNELNEMEEKGANTEDIKAAFCERYDIESLVDYYLFCKLTYNRDGYFKNWQWFTYDGKKWFVTPYDLDQTMGMILSGQVLFPANLSYSDNNSGPLYWMNKYFTDEIGDRYRYLRENGILTVENWQSLFTNWYYRVGESFYEKEKTKWSESPCYNDLILSPGWTTTDNFSNIYNESINPKWNENTVYEAGDHCMLDDRIFIAKEHVQGIKPYQVLAQRDSLERVNDWIAVRIPFFDKKYKVDATSKMMTYTINVSSAGMSTVCVPFQFECPEGLTLYSVSGIDGTSLVLEAATEIQANQPYLIIGVPGQYRISGQYVDKGMSYDLSNGLLVGTDSDQCVAAGNYVLQNKNGKTAFYRVDSDDTIRIQKYRAYLHLPDNLAKGALYLVDVESAEATGIQTMDYLPSSHVLYNLQGVPVTKEYKGIIISNGKRYINK